MSTVTIKNYSFPINFSYKGWHVKIIDNTGFFSMKDLRVIVKMTVDSEKISSEIAHAMARIININEMQKKIISQYPPYNMNLMHEDNAIFQQEYNHIVKLAEEFAKKKGVIEYSIALNGNMLDRFFGQNISAVEKMCQQVVEKIDRIYGNVQEEFLQTLK